MNNKEFGKKIICNSYLKKLKIKYVVVNREQFEKYSYNIDNSVIYEELSQDERSPYSQRIRELKEYKFNGIIIGEKLVPTQYDYDYCENYDRTDWDYNHLYCDKTKNIDCWVVAYANNKTRLVPKEQKTIKRKIK